jgi:hypothetical protein
MIMLFWDLAPCRLAGRCQRFGETYILSPSSALETYVSPKRWRLHGAKTKNNNFFYKFTSRVTSPVQHLLFIRSNTLYIYWIHTLRKGQVQLLTCLSDDLVPKIITPNLTLFVLFLQLLFWNTSSVFKKKE